MIPSLLAFGVVFYGAFWLRHRLRGGLVVSPELRALWLLALAAMIYVTCRLVVTAE